MKKTSVLKVRRSPIHGTGVFAKTRIRKGARVVEYIGDRISHAEADRRYEHKPADDNHTFLFIVDKRTVIDAGVGGNEARFINHSCDPNCETVIQDRRVFIEAVRAIEPGEELGYDYQITRDPDDPDDVEEIFGCRCGAESCRGTMLEPRKPPRRKARRKAAGAAGKRAAGKRVDGTGRRADKGKHPDKTGRAKQKTSRRTSAKKKK